MAANQKMREFAVVRRVDIHPPSRHSAGVPREVDPYAHQVHMDWPILVLIHEEQTGVFLERFDNDGESVGDTWHETVEDAKAQATAEYEDAVGEWMRLPNDLDVAEAYDAAKRIMSSRR